VYLARRLVITLLLLPAMVCAVAQDTGGARAAPVQQETRDAGTVKETPAQRAALEQRVIAKWETLVRRDFTATYAFTSPAYRSAFSLEAFRRKFGNGKVVWKRVEVVSVDFKGDDAAIVGIKIHIVYHDSQSQRSIDMATNAQESWVYADGQWWYVVED